MIHIIYNIKIVPLRYKMYIIRVKIKNIFRYLSRVGVNETRLIRLLLLIIIIIIHYPWTQTSILTR